MLSHPDDSDDGLLGESTYEILSDLSVPSHSDDDDDLSSLASLADDDAEEQDEDEVEFTFPNPNADEPKHTSDDERSTYAESVPDVPDRDDELECTGIPTYTGLDRHEAPPSQKFLKGENYVEDTTIRFKGGDVPVGEETTLSYDIQEFQGVEFDELQAAWAIPESVTNLHSVLRCTLGLDAMCVKDTFRVLYIGDESAKEDIIRKLGAALVVHSATETVENSKSSDRFNIIPVTSFGNNSANPEVELVESFGLEMAVDTCASAAGVNDGKGGDLLTLVIKPRLMVRSVRSNKICKLHAPGWRLPHLAIFYCGANDDFQKRQTRSYARAFAVRHKIPFITISDKKMYGSTEEFQIDYRIIHMAVESRRTDENGVKLREVYKELPIDLQSYLNLDVQQLSKNLSTVIKQQDDEHNSPPEKTAQPWKRFTQIMSDMLDDGMSERNLNLVMVILFGVLLSAVCLGLSIVLASFMRPASVSGPFVHPGKMTSLATTTSLGSVNSKPIDRMEPPKNTPSSSEASSKASPTTSLISRATSSSVTSVSTISNGVTSLSLTDLPSLPANESNEFTMYTISDGSIVLRSPKKFAALRRAPAVIVHVKRRSQTVPVEVNKLFRGVYSIRMDLNNAWGLLNITIKTDSKPIINQSFVLDLGNPWLSKEAWKRSVLATSSDLKKAVDRASSAANDYAQKIHEQGMKQIDMAKQDIKKLRIDTAKLSEEIQNMRGEAARIRKDISKHSEVAKKTVESQLKVLRDGFDDLKLDQYLGSFSGYKKQIDDQVQKARKNANQLWNKKSKVPKPAAVKATKKNTKSCGSRKWGRKGGCKNSR